MDDLPIAIEHFHIIDFSLDLDRVSKIHKINSIFLFYYVFHIIDNINELVGISIYIHKYSISKRAC